MSSGQLSKIIFLYLAKQVIKSCTRKFIVNIPVRKPLIEEVFVKSC